MVAAPQGKRASGILKAIKDLAVQQSIAKAAAGCLEEGASRRGLPGPTWCRATPFCPARPRMARLVNPVPLLGKTIPWIVY